MVTSLSSLPGFIKDLLATRYDFRDYSKSDREMAHLLSSPYGAYDAKVLTQANRLGLTIVMWNVDPEDWSMPGSNAIISRVLRRAGSGSIILMHDGGGNRAQTVQALPIIIESLLRRGFTFVTLQQMVDHLHRKMHRATTLAHTIGSSAIVLRGYPFSRRRKDVPGPTKRCYYKQ